MKLSTVLVLFCALSFTSAVASKKVSSVKVLPFTDILLTKTNQGRSSEIKFQVPKNAQSFSVVMSSSEAKNYLYVYSLHAPDGSAWITPDPKNISPEIGKKASRGQAVSPNAVQVEVFKEISSTLVPNASSLAIQPGEWKLVIAREDTKSKEDESIDVSIVIKVSPYAASLKRPRSLTINPWIAPQSGLTISEADPLLAAQLKDFIEFFKSIGVQVKLNPPKKLAAKYNAAHCDLSGKFNDLFSELMTEFPSKPNQVNVFFLEPNNNDPEGIATYNGAAAGFHAANRFGGIIMRDGRNPSATLAHELGHYLGLYHINIDFLDDTKHYDHAYFGDEKPDFETDQNLMDLSYGPLKLSPSQIRILRQSPLVEDY